MVIVDTDAEQGGLEIIHLKTLTPIPKPLTFVVGDNEFEIIPEPEIKVQVPTPTVAVFAAIVAGLPIQSV